MMHSGGLHVVERFSLDRERMALRREYVATDPDYFTGEFRGVDVAFPADLPWEPPTCNDLSYATGRGTLAAQPAAPQSAAAPESEAAAPTPAPAKPWWKFWD
jgi:hypothetical protein